jgi:hypothetical protein
MRKIKMDFSKKAEIVGDYYVFHADEEWRAMNDLGGPLAYALKRGWVDEVRGEGAAWIETSYADILDQHELDPYSEFDSLEELLEIAEYPNAEG